MKRIVFVFLIPLGLFLNIWQAFEYQQIETSVRYIEKEQRKLLESNQESVVAIAVLSSGTRIQQIAEQDLNLVKPQSEKSITLEVTSQK